ncbi:MAG: glycoside hydrolase family 32 protein, partial [Lewinellaceae bacterium]|nr:glycoside hydrolase family 32 protein [Lewinellaceae bacterium]
MPKSFAFIAIVLITFFAPACGEKKQKNQLEKTTGTTTYQEPHRPQFHFSPKEKWMNDPNGMFFYDGEYHLFYQYYPESTVWGPMHWGHAVSTDLTHWTHLPIALYPDSLGYIFSGSAVVDWNNTSGFGKDGAPPLVAIFTYHDAVAAEAGRTDYQYQGIAYSTDKGRNWTKYADNPVVPNTEDLRDFRDPKVFWHVASEQWIMALAVYDHVAIWGSSDLKNWKHLSDFGKEWGAHSGVWECPDLFPLPVEGTGDTKWVLLLSINPGGPFGGSATQYFVGNFDGKQFTLDQSFSSTVSAENAVWLDRGRDNYAGVTWSDIPKTDGRRLFLGWMGNWDYAQVVPTDAWRSAMTLPRTLTLHQTADSYRLFAQPVPELKALRATSHTIKPANISGMLDLTEQIGCSPAQLELVLDFETLNDGAVDFGVELSNGRGEYYRIGYDAEAGQFYSDRSKSGDLRFSEKFAGEMPVAARMSTNK